MKYGEIPYFERPVSKLILGSIPFSESDPDRAFALLDRYVERGGNSVDTAHIYGSGEQQRVVGRWMRERQARESLLLFDKGCHPYGHNRVTRGHMFSDLEENHERLGVNFTEFFVLHRDDPSVPAGEIVSWLNELKSKGRIAVFGGSNWTVERIREANEYAERNGLQGFSVNNPNLSLATINEPMWAGCHTVTHEERAWHQVSGFPLFSWSSMGGGYFAGVQSADVLRVYDNEENRRRRSRASELAKLKGATTVQIALAWTLLQPINVWALIGPRTIGELDEAIDALELQLSPDELNWLENGPSEKS